MMYECKRHTENDQIDHFINRPLQNQLFIAYRSYSHMNARRHQEFRLAGVQCPTGQCKKSLSKRPFESHCTLFKKIVGVDRILGRSS